MAKAKTNLEAVNIVSKNANLRLSANTTEPTLATFKEKDHSKSVNHSRFQTLEEILYSLDDKMKMPTDPAEHFECGITDDGDDSVKDIDEDCSGTFNDNIASSSRTSYTSNAVSDEARARRFESESKLLHLSEEQLSKGGHVKAQRSRIKDPAFLDFYSDTNLDSDIEQSVPIEDIQAQHRLLDDQLQQRIQQYFLEDLDLEEDFGDINSHMLGTFPTPSKPDFPESVEFEEKCWICFDDLLVQKRWCCDFQVCHSCMDMYLEIQVNMGILKISCINGDCSSYIHREEIYTRLSNEIKEKFYRFLVNANQYPHIKTCPKCSHVYNAAELGIDDRKKYGDLAICPECRLQWCFRCHAPWHFGVKCKDFKKGDKLVKHWASEQHYGVINAQKCPKCKIFIERKGGCDHMTCIRCNTGFCYRCGDRYRDLKFLGNHMSRFSIVGCKYNYLPNHPIARRISRGSIFGAELLGGVVLLGLGVAAAGLLLGASVVILPAFGGYKYHKHRKLRRILKQEQELFRTRTRNAMVEMQRERAVLERHTERLHQQTGLSDGAIGPVHIGIQTDQPQKVDVTVHSPTAANSTSHGEETVDSKICMNISDKMGQVTVTTAEITHNASKGEGSEAEVVLHVRTTYNTNKDDVAEENTALTIDTDTEPSSYHDECMKGGDNDSKVKQTEHNSGSELSPMNDLMTPESVQQSNHTRTASLPVKSDQFQSKGGFKCNTGKQSLRHSDKSRKHSKTKDTKSSEAVLQSTGTSQPDQDQEGALPDTALKASEDQEDNLENEYLSQSGCFLKLFSRKFNTLQSQLGKEREKISLKRSLSEPIDYTHCPDLVSCILASEMKGRDNKDNVQEETREPTQLQIDGLVAKESCSTSL